MNLLSTDPLIGTSKAAQLVEKNFEKVAQTLDGLRSSLLEQNTSDGSPLPLSGNLAARLAASSDRLRAADGEDVVVFAKDKLVRHSAAVSVVAAAVAAVAVQMAVAVVRRERRQNSQPNITLASI